MRKLSLTVFVCLMLVSVPVYAQILNGSFESGPDPVSFVTVPPGTGPDNWTVTSGTVDYIGTYWTAADGSRSLDLSGNGPGITSQAFTTLPGKLYTILFSMAGNPDGTQGVKQIRVTATGGSPQTYSFNTSSDCSGPCSTTNMGWRNESYTFAATGTSTSISFESLTNSAWGPALDNVRLLAQGDPNSITIIKDAIPDSPTSFAFTSTNFGTFTLTDDGITPGLRSQTFLIDATNTPLPHTFSFSESVPAGWTLTSINCVTQSTGVTWDSNLTTSTLNVNVLGTGQEITCTFTDQPKPVSVPTMTELGMIIFMILAALGAAHYLRRQRKA